MIYNGKIWLLDTIYTPLNKKDTLSHYEWLKEYVKEGNDLIYLLMDDYNGERGVLYGFYKDMKIRIY